MIPPSTSLHWIDSSVQIPPPTPPPHLPKLSPSTLTESNNIVNLSKHPLTPPQTTLLDKGLKFIPTPHKFPTELIETSLSRFTRNLKLKSFFSEDPNPDYDPNAKTFENKSDWTPRMSQIDPATRQAILDIEELTDKFIKTNQHHHHIITRQKSNLSPTETHALKEIKQLPDIIIKPADKGSAIVVMDHLAYTFEAYRQLLDRKYYHSLDQPIYPSNSSKIRKILFRMYEEKYITSKQLAYLQPPIQPRPTSLLPTPQNTQTQKSMNTPPYALCPPHRI